MTTKKHANNPELTGEHAWGDAGQIILFLIFLLVWIADSFFWIIRFSGWNFSHWQ